MLQHIFVVISMAVADILYTLWARKAAQGKATWAALWASLIIPVYGSVVIMYNSNIRYLISATVGAFLGTYIAVKLDKKAKISKIFNLAKVSAKFLAFFVVVLAMAGVTKAEKLYIPPAWELKTDPAKQAEINRKLDVTNSLALVEVGLIEPGWIDLDHPNVRFQLAYNRWIKLWNKSVEQGSIDYQEVLAFDEVVKRFEKFVERVERERKFGN